MALPASGTISLSDIQTTMGGSNPISLTEYYRGGTYVPNITANNAIPTSGTISITDFYGALGSVSSNHTLTVGSRSYTEFKVNYIDYGYSTSVYTYGSLSPTTYSSSLGTITINDCYWNDSTNSFHFRINKNTNADTAFYEIVVNGTTYARSAAGFTDGGTYGIWIWASPSNPFPTSGNVTLTVRRYA